MSDNNSTDVDCTPPEIVEAANNTALNLLPNISRKKYEIVYKRFMDWRHDNKINSFSENVIMAYFGDLSKKFKSSTLWSQYSMLKSTLYVKENINLAKYPKLRAFLKRQSDGYIAKKSKTLTSIEINTFLNEAPDIKYLLIKVVLIIGITGACRRNELRNIKLSDIDDLQTALYIKIPDTKTKVPRQFTVTGNFYNICKKYMCLRPPKLKEEALFLNYQNGKCTRQVVGVNKIGSMPKEIANYFKLPNPELYTGHCFRRSSATLLVDGGGDLTTLKRHGGWKSSTVAEGYIDNSMRSKMEIADTILKSVENSDIITTPTKNPIESSSNTNHNITSDINHNINLFASNTSTVNETNKQTPTITFNNCTNVNVYFNENK